MFVQKQKVLSQINYPKTHQVTQVKNFFNNLNFLEGKMSLVHIFLPDGANFLTQPLLYYYSLQKLIFQK